MKHSTIEMKNNGMIFLVVISLLFACKSSKPQQAANNVAITKTLTLSQQLIGSWQWIKTNCCGRLNTITTPESTKQNILYTFDKGGMASKNVNGKTESITYSIGNTFNAEKDTMLQLGNTPRPAYIHFKADTLIIDYGYIDLQTEWYVRVEK